MKKLLLLLTITLCFTECRKEPANQNELTVAASPKSRATSSSVADFTIAVIPDTQYYTSSQFGGTPAMFTSQIDWIKANQVTENIQYVISLGDITDHGNDYTSEWTNSSTYGYYKLESQSGFTNGIPYGTCVGNHDQTPNTGHPLTCSTSSYNAYFGANRFRPRAYYGENYAGTGSNSNDSHYDLITAGGVDFIIIYVEYDSHGDDGANMNTWAYNLLGTYASRKAIIVSHMGLQTGNPAPWAYTGSTYEQAHVLYDRIKPRTNVIMMLSGHWTGEGYREDVYDGNTIRSYMSDYQGWANGGSGYMRLMKFSVDNNTVSVKTYSPYLNTYQTDSDSQFTTPIVASSGPDTFENDVTGTLHGPVPLGYNWAGTSETQFGCSVYAGQGYNGTDGLRMYDGSSTWRAGIKKVLLPNNTKTLSFRCRTANLPVGTSWSVPITGTVAGVNNTVFWVAFFADATGANGIVKVNNGSGWVQLGTATVPVGTTWKQITIVANESANTATLSIDGVQQGGTFAMYADPASAANLSGFAFCSNGTATYGETVYFDDVTFTN